MADSVTTIGDVWYDSRGNALAGQTWIEREERAYNTYSGAPSNSNRQGLVRFPDGKLRHVRLGVADTFFSIPAKPSHGKVGHVTFTDGEFRFTSADWRNDV